MSGEKLEYVKKALESASDLLEYEDRVSLVIYDSNVSTVYEAAHFGKDEFLSVLEGIQSGSSTYLEGGLRAGLVNVGEFSSDEYINRVVLLSDGLANVGESDPDRLAGIVEGFAGDAIVSTIGVGADFDERLMTTVARAGRGNYYFLEDPADAERIFTEEFDSALGTVAKDIEIKFNLSEDFNVTSGIGYDLEDKAQFYPHDLYAGREVTYLFEIDAVDAARLELGEISLADIEVNYASVPNGKKGQVSIPVRSNVIQGENNVLADDLVYGMYMKSYIADDLWEVYEQLDRNENDSARKTLEDLLVEVEQANSRLDGQYEAEIGEIKEKQEFLESLETEYINESEEGRTYQKDNQSDSYDEKYNK